MNNLPSSLLQKLMKKSSTDASVVVANGGSTHALEAMYGRNRRSIFSRGLREGLADIFWHHVISQPKALRNRLKIVEHLIEEDVLSILNNRKAGGDNSTVKILNVGGGSSRAIIHTLDRLKDKIVGGPQVLITNFDKSSRAIDLGKNIAKEYNLENNFEWINDDARNLLSRVPKESFDLVEIVGLLDYFSNEKSTVIISQIFQALKTGGTLIVANVFPNSEMSFVSRTGWPKMHYKTPDDIKRILNDSGFVSEPFIELEPLKVHIIAVTRK